MRNSPIIEISYCELAGGTVLFLKTGRSFYFLLFEITLALYSPPEFCIFKNVVGGE
jgi:hypothetical protein